MPVIDVKKTHPLFSRSDFRDNGRRTHCDFSFGKRCGGHFEEFVVIVLTGPEFLFMLQFFRGRHGSDGSDGDGGLVFALGC